MGQKMTQDAAALKDELKGMFDDRNMLVRMEQKEMERKVHSIPLTVLALNHWLPELRDSYRAIAIASHLS